MHVNLDGSQSEKTIRRITISNYTRAMQADPPTATVCEICASAINMILFPEDSGWGRRRR